MKGIGPGAALAALTLAMGAAPRAAAQDTNHAALADRVQELEQELALLKRKLEVEAETQASKGPQPVLSAGADGFALRSADSSSELRIRGYVQFDSRRFSASGEYANGADTFFFRRIRPIIEGKLADFVDFRIMPDFANSQLVIQDAWANLRFLPEAQLMFGKFKGPVGLERLQSATALWFVERALPTQLVPNRDLGVIAQGVAREGLFTYQVGWMNGVTDGGSADTDANDDKDVVARVFAHPFQETEIGALQGLGIGFATTYGHEIGTPGSYKTSGQQTFFAFASGVTQTGTRARYAPQAYWYFGPVGLLAEYVYDTAQFARPGAPGIRANNSAWQIAGAWALTGENEAYKGLLPSAGFSPGNGHWGAVELAARFSQLKVDGNVFANGYANPATQAESATLWSVGLNWYLNRNVKLMFDYDLTSFRNFDGNANRPDEGVFLTEFQLSY